MWAYGVCVGPSGKFDRYAGPSSKRFSDETSALLTINGRRSMFAAYNNLLDQAAAIPQCTRLVLLHDDVEIIDDPRPIAGALLDDPSVALVGLLGARRPTSLAWWRAGQRRGRLPDYASAHDYGRGTFEVDTVDDPFLVVSRWAIENLRFPRDFTGYEGLGVVISSLVRAAGKRVLTADIEIQHHNSSNDYNSINDFRRNDLAYQRLAFRHTPWQLMRNRFGGALSPTVKHRLAFRRAIHRAKLWRPRVNVLAETSDPVLNDFLQRCHERAQRFAGREKIPYFAGQDQLQESR